MDSRSVIQESIDYMEENLKAEIRAEELAERAGFSVYHFYRLFHSTVGMPVMQYLTRRRLLHAAYAISRGSTGVDAALCYGFDTYAGFYRAFRREYGCTIAEFLESGRGKIPRRVNLMQEAHRMVSKKEAASVLRSWGLEQAEIQDIYYENGTRNENAYYVGDTCVLKFTNDPDKVSSHCTLTGAAQRLGLLAAVPVPTRNGQNWVCNEGLYFYLTQRLPGKQMKAERLCESGNARLLGELIGQLHLALAQVDAAVQEADLLETVRTWALPEGRKVLELPQRTWEVFLRDFSEQYPLLPRQIIHRDPNPGNIIGDGENWGFVDFELSERNARIYDPCYAAAAILSELPGSAWHRWPQVYRELLAGYDGVVHLTDTERAAAANVLLANQLVCVAWFAGQDKYTQLLKTNVEMTRFIVENLEALKL